MSYKISAVDVYAGDIMNRPGRLARVLEALATAGANLEFVIARRVSDNTSRVFVAPLSGKAARASKDVDLQRAKGMYVIRVEGPDKAGLGAFITRKMAAQGINLRGLSAASVAKKNVCYIALSTAADAKNAAKVLKKSLSGKLSLSK